MKRLRKLVQRLLARPEVRHVIGGACAAAVLLFLAPALAAGGGGHHGSDHVNWWTRDMGAPPVGWFLVDFVLFIGLLVYFLKGPFAKLFAARHDTIKKSIEDAGKALDKARKHHGEYTDKLARVDSEVEGLVQGGESDGKAERERILKSAKDYAERMRKDTETLIHQEFSRAQSDLQRQTALSALALAEKLVKKNINEADHQRLIDSALAELAQGGENNSAGKSAAPATTGGAT